MNTLSRLSILVALGALAACDSDDTAPADASSDAQASRDAATGAVTKGDAAKDDDAGDEDDAGTATTSTVLKLDDVTSKPDEFEWFDFRPNVKKLILSGAAETEHVAILWYTTEDGGVGLHYHAKTESVYVIDGTQTDAKGDYKTGTVYFNPPGSGHEIKHSSGFFVLAYAAPPDFMKTDLIEEYTPIRIDTSAADLTSEYDFEKKSTGVRVYDAPLPPEGGMSASFLEIASNKTSTYTGNYLLVLRGSCEVEGTKYGERTLVVAKTVQPKTYAVGAPKGSECLALGVSF
jgi:hypothetical protein